MPIKRLYIQNFKSIRDSGDINIRPINILIGPNGVGKSNFINFFKLLKNIYNQNLKKFAADNGYADRVLYFGRKSSKFIAGGIVFNTRNRYDFKLVPNQENQFYFETETGGYNHWGEEYGGSWDFASTGAEGEAESKLKERGQRRFDFIRGYFDNLNIYHFHDTSSSSALKQTAITNDYEWLREDGSNLPAFLYKIQQTNPANFKMIEYTIRSVAPFFDKFNLKPDEINPSQIFLNWFEKGSDAYFNAHNLSDGSLRFIALAAVLLQPKLPEIVIIDEPELGLHPSAIIKLGAMIKSASKSAQIIVSTQSVNLLDQFEPEDVIVVEREDNQSVFKRLSSEELSNWRDEFSLGQMWSKNILGGTP